MKAFLLWLSVAFTLAATAYVMVALLADRSGNTQLALLNYTRGSTLFLMALVTRHLDRK